MSYTNSEALWLLLDHTDTLERERSGGYSMFEQKGKRELQKLPYCPICRRQIWLHAITYMEKISFTGLLIGDAAWTYGMTFVVSKRFIDCWRKDKLNGLTFSSEPINISFKRKAVFVTPIKAFFLALPEPRLTRFDITSKAVYREAPCCTVCSSSEVVSVDKLFFEEGTIEELDCFLPSCLPGWTVVSANFKKFIEKYNLMNFNLIEGFKRKEDRSLLRMGYWKQQSNGHYITVEE